MNMDETDRDTASTIAALQQELAATRQELVRVQADYLILLDEERGKVRADFNTRMAEATAWPEAWEEVDARRRRDANKLVGSWFETVLNRSNFPIISEEDVDVWVADMLHANNESGIETRLLRVRLLEDELARVRTRAEAALRPGPRPLSFDRASRPAVVKADASDAPGGDA
jgi:hypothetical protein